MHLLGPMIVVTILFVGFNHFFTEWKIPWWVLAISAMYFLVNVFLPGNASDTEEEESEENEKEESEPVRTKLERIKAQRLERIKTKSNKIEGWK